MKAQSHLRQIDLHAVNTQSYHDCTNCIVCVLFLLSVFRPTDLELHLSEKASKKVEEDMGYIKLQAKLVPKTQEEKEQVGSQAGDQQETYTNTYTVLFMAVRMTILR